MRVLVAGAGGQLGGEVVRVWSAAGDQVIACDRQALDVTDEAAVRAAMSDFAPEVVVNCAAATDVDRCETDRDWAWAVNAGGASNLARACATAGVWLVHVSTDYVFDGALGRPYTEFDRACPVSLYGRSKEAGEQLVRQALPGHQIVRTAWLHGVSGEGFAAGMLARARRDGQVKAVAEQVGNPTFAGDLAPALRRLAVTGRAGTFHLVNDGHANRVELTEAVLAAAGVDAAITLVDAEHFGLPAPRPADSRLDGVHTRLAGVPALPHWRETLARLFAPTPPEATDAPEAGAR